ncbi:MAG: protein adenylyltransferase SelO family protein [Bdellovibrio sp.]
MTMKHNGAKKQSQLTDFYSSFDQLNGYHPWMDAVKDGFIEYRVRQLNIGKVAYFNFILAKEMGLISPDHPEQMTPELEQKLLETFSIQIINEYDELTNRRIDPAMIKPHKYMATRYLQLQHANKQGKTSGDGRGIWNGTVYHRGTTWDVSSRGTGVTRLSPGSVEANRPLKTGGTEFGYGCGLAEIDELFGASILAEVMHLQGIRTERVLCVIDLGKGYGIGVRAAHNLIRPAHLFLYLKQERRDALKTATDYLIGRQNDNKAWNITARGNAKYDELLQEVCKAFAEFAAKLDTDYIFAWLDWDGDNVLADAGIIDYGSVRQFGIRHDKYRYDDVERFSTNLNEQKQKARLIVQVFAQMVDYLKTGEKKALKAYATHPISETFNKHFEAHREERLLYRMGFNEAQRRNIIEEKGLFAKFDKEFTYFERAKISGTTEKVADGINHAALYNMRSILRELPYVLAQSPLPFEKRWMSNTDFFKTILSSFAKTRDARIGEKQRRHIEAFQQIYREMVTVAAGKQKPENIIKGISERAELLNSEKRITGNALIEMVDEILTEKKRGLPLDQIQRIVDRLVIENNGMPEVPVSRYYKEKENSRAVKIDLYAKLLSLVEENKESI